MGQPLRIVSGNLLNGRANMDVLLELFTSLAADVVALQEVSPGQVDCLRGLLPHGEIVPHHNYVGMALMTRRPVAIERIPLAWAFGQTARLDTENWPEIGSALEITNIHVAAPHLYRPAPGFFLRWRQLQEFCAYLEAADARGGLDLPGSARPPRTGPQERSSAARSAPARVLVGDFNSTPYWPWYRRMASQFTDAAVTVAKARGVSLRSTWGPLPGGPKLFRIDHGFVRGVEVEDFRVLEIEGSDHSALAMDVSLPSSSSSSS